MPSHESSSPGADWYRALVDSMTDAVFGVDAAGTVFFANPQAAKLTGRRLEELLGVNFRVLMTPDSAMHVAAQIERDAGQPATWEVTLLDANRRPLPVEIHVAWYAEECVGAPCMQWVVRDMTERRRYERELVHLATHDHLTGVFNRMRFEEELESRLANVKRVARTAALLWIDLDNFKDVNDTYGHKAGDEVLVSLASQLARRLRGGSVLARLGGDEFGVLLPDVEPGEIRRLAQRVLDEVRSMELYAGGVRIRVTPSIGVVILPEQATTPEEALARADVAMYHAKETGGNRVCFYRADEDWSEELGRRLDWAATIESALAEDRVLVFWQPIVDLATGRVDRYEVLIRLLDEAGEVLPPGAFLPIAEQSGLVSTIDHHVITRAVQLLGSTPTGDETRVDVNLSGRAIADPELPEVLEAALCTSRVDAARLGIEVTETAAIVDTVRSRAFMEGVKGLGVRVSLDAVGSGFSSFYHLRNLPIDSLKIDGMFIRDLPESVCDQHVVRSIVELAHGLDVTTTAACVESAETLALVKRLGVDYAQGFYVGRPEPVGGESSGMGPARRQASGAG